MSENIWSDIVNESKKKEDYPSLFPDMEFRPSVKVKIRPLCDFNNYLNIDLLRLGKITSDYAYMLMTPRKEDDFGNVFASNTITYLNSIIAQRNVNDSIRENQQLFSNYLSSQRIKRFGVDVDVVRQCVSKYDSDNGCKCEMVGIVECEGYMDGFCDFPSAIVRKDGKTIGCISVKVFNSGADFVYLYDNFQKGRELFQLDKHLYWECVAHCLSLSVEWCDLIYIDTNQKNGLQIERIKPPIYTIDNLCDDSIISLHENIKKAIKYVNSSYLLNL